MKFQVTLELTGHVTIEVEAIDVLEARETAQAHYSASDVYDEYRMDFEEVIPITVGHNEQEVWHI